MTIAKSAQSGGIWTSDSDSNGHGMTGAAAASFGTVFFFSGATAFVVFPASDTDLLRFGSPLPLGLDFD